MHTSFNDIVLAGMAMAFIIIMSKIVIRAIKDFDRMGRERERKLGQPSNSRASEVKKEGVKDLTVI